MPGIDLHTHTHYSDGTLSPLELFQLAAERGLDTLALTDHDTTSGLPEAREAADATGVELVPGVEFSAEYEGASLHVLCYWPDEDDADFQAELMRLQDSRLRRGELMVEKLQELGYPVRFERIREIAAGKNIVRPHIAQAMVEAGIIQAEDQAYTDEFIGDGGRAYVEKHALDPVDALALIKKAGGVCVIAHPAMWRGQESVPDALIEKLAAAGMDGVEVDHPDQTPEARTHYRDLAQRLGLVVTGSTDYHGERSPGILPGDERTDPAQFEALKERRR
ncbi:MAG: PHP domain-containing protein [Actinomycetota bacterium]